MNNTIKFSVDEENSGKRLDIFLKENINNFTRSFLKKLIENRQVKLNEIIKNFDKEILNFIQVCPKEMLDKLKHPITTKSTIKKVS